MLKKALFTAFTKCALIFFLSPAMHAGDFLYFFDKGNLVRTQLSEDGSLEDQEILLKLPRGTQGNIIVPYNADQLIFSVAVSKSNRPNRVFLFDINNRTQIPLNINWKFLGHMFIKKSVLYLSSVEGVWAYRLNANNSNPILIFRGDDIDQMALVGDFCIFLSGRTIRKFDIGRTAPRNRNPEIIEEHFRRATLLPLDHESFLIRDEDGFVFIKNIVDNNLIKAGRFYDGMTVLGKTVRELRGSLVAVDTGRGSIPNNNNGEASTDNNDISALPSVSWNTILHIPELTAYTLSFLNPVERIIASGTCKEWHTIIKAMPACNIHSENAPNGTSILLRDPGNCCWIYGSDVYSEEGHADCFVLNSRSGCCRQIRDEEDNSKLKDVWQRDGFLYCHFESGKVTLYGKEGKIQIRGNNTDKMLLINGHPIYYNGNTLGTNHVNKYADTRVLHCTDTCLQNAKLAQYQNMLIAVTGNNLYIIRLPNNFDRSTIKCFMDKENTIKVLSPIPFVEGMTFFGHQIFTEGDTLRFIPISSDVSSEKTKDSGK